jgi:ArsR family transcriptional regulator
MIARRFRALGEPSRLSVLHALEAGPLTVTELIEAVGLSQGNLSKHLQLLHANGLVARRRDGLFVYYSLADDRVLQLCELMCGRLDDELAMASVTVRKGRRA